MILWTVAHQGPLSMGFTRQEYWSGLPCPSPVYPPDPGIEPMTLLSPTLAGGFFTTTATWENSWLPSSKIKQIFLSINLASSLAFEQRVAGLHLQSLYYLEIQRQMLYDQDKMVVFLLPVYPLINQSSFSSTPSSHD